MNGYELMSSRGHASEDALGNLGCAALGKDAAVLIGGLGLGYTLRAALNVLPAGARVTVAELLPEMIAWVRGPLAHLVGDALGDARVALHRGDVGALLQASCDRFDAVLLDIDNGPEARVRPGNAWLGQHEGLVVIRRALRRPGLLAVWSADPCPRFEAAVDDAGFDLDATTVAATGAGGPLHTIYLARIT